MKRLFVILAALNGLIGSFCALAPLSGWHNSLVLPIALLVIAILAFLWSALFCLDQHPVLTPREPQFARNKNQKHQ